MDMRQLRNLNLEETKVKIKASFTQDTALIQAIHNIEELVKIINRLMESLREWYGYYYPELIKNIKNNEEILELILSNKKKNDSVGYDFNKEDLEIINNFAKNIKKLYELKEKQENYVDKKIRNIAPNLSKIADTLIIAKLIEKAGGLKNLAELPSSTIQVLGAEKSFFKGLKEKKTPKFGVIFANSSVVNAKKNEKAKIARKLASKIVIAARLDYFKNDRKD